MKRVQLSQLKSWLKEIQEKEQAYIDASFHMVDNEQVRSQMYMAKGRKELCEAILLAFEGDPSLLKTYLPSEEF